MNLRAEDGTVGLKRQVAGEPIDARSDIYRLGVVLYQALSGRLPFEGPLLKVLAGIADAEPPSPRLLCPELNTAIETICTKAMAKQPADRYASARESAEALHDYLQGDVQGVVPPSRHRWRWWVARTGGAAVLLAGVVGRREGNHVRCPSGLFLHIHVTPVEGGKPTPLTRGDWNDVDPDVWGDAPSLNNTDGH